jgi:membrane protein
VIEQNNIIWEPGGTEAQTKAGTARRHRKPLTTFRWCDIKALLGDTVNEWYKHKAPRLGASLAFYTLLSLAPLLVVVIAIAGLMFGQDAAQGRIVEQIQGLVGRDSAVAIQAMVEGARKPAAGTIATILGLLTLFFGATTVVAELRDALNTIWEVPQVETSGIRSIIGVLRERFFSLAMVLGVGFILLVSLVVNAWLSAIGGYFTGWLSEVTMQVANSMLSLIVITALFAMIYKVMPDVSIEWRDVALGAIFTSLLFTGGKFLIGLYLGKSGFGSTYGAAGSLVIVLLWVYYSAQIFFFGAEFTQVFANRYGSQPTVRAKRRLLGTIHPPAPIQIPQGERLVQKAP